MTFFYVETFGLFLLAQNVICGDTARVEEAAAGWVGSSEYICHMEQAKYAMHVK